MATCQTGVTFNDNVAPEKTAPSRKPHRPGTCSSDLPCDPDRSRAAEAQSPKKRARGAQRLPPGGWFQEGTLSPAHRGRDLWSLHLPPGRERLYVQYTFSTSSPRTFRKRRLFHSGSTPGWPPARSSSWAHRQRERPRSTIQPEPAGRWIGWQDSRPGHPRL